MKFRNFIIVLLAVLMAFAFASCKHEPKTEPKPTPQPKGDIYQIEVTEGNQNESLLSIFCVTIKLCNGTKSLTLF